MVLQNVPKEAGAGEDLGVCWENDEEDAGAAGSQASSDDEEDASDAGSQASSDADSQSSSDAAHALARLFYDIVADSFAAENLEEDVVVETPHKKRS